MKMEINKIYCMDSLEFLKALDDESIDMCITSPPYWGLRDYGVEGQIGLEPHPNEWIKKMVEICRELRRVLKKTGSFYLNVGDTYFGSCSDKYSIKNENSISGKGHQMDSMPEKSIRNNKEIYSNWLQPKQLMLMPSRLAIALQEDGWILRNDIIWNKPNPMPSSVKDRLNNTFEHLFHFVKNKKYYYDLDAIREKHQNIKLTQDQYEELKDKTGSFHDHSFDSEAGWGQEKKEGFKAVSNPLGKNPGDIIGAEYQGKWKDDEEYMNKMQQRINDARASGLPHDFALSHPLGKNPGDFFSITTQPFPEAHFATFPEKLLEKPVKSSCPKEICKKCGFVRERIVETDFIKVSDSKPAKIGDGKRNPENRTDLPSNRGYSLHNTKGFTSCSCNAGFKPGIVLDMFMGSGTTALVALKNGLNYIGCDLSQEYIKIAEKRLSKLPNTKLNDFGA